MTHTFPLLNMFQKLFQIFDTFVFTHTFSFRFKSYKPHLKSTKFIANIKFGFVESRKEGNSILKEGNSILLLESFVIQFMV